MAKILVSACLMGCECRYKGDSCRNEKILALAGEHTLLAVCPEQMGGLPTPRYPAEIQGDRLINSAGADVTAEYRKGAETACYLAKLNGVKLAIMKANSPSCGHGLIYDGTFSGNKVPGNGVTAELLEDSGIKVFTEDELDELMKVLS